MSLGYKESFNESAALSQPHEVAKRFVEGQLDAENRQDMNGADPDGGLNGRMRTAASNARLITCADCGNVLTSCWSKSKTGKKHPYYMCFQKGCVSYRKSIRRDDLEGAFEALLAQMKPSERLLRYLKVIFKAEWEKRLASLKVTKTVFAREITRIEKQVESLIERIVQTDNQRVAEAYERKIAALEKEKLDASNYLPFSFVS